MRRIKLAIVATCTAVAAATTITPAYAADVEPDTSTALSEEIEQNSVLKTIYSVLWDIVTFPLALSIVPLMKPRMAPNSRRTPCVPSKSQSPQHAWPWQQLHSPQHPQESSLNSLPLWTVVWISSASAPCQSMGQSSPIWCAPVSLPQECLPDIACGKP